LRDLPSVRDFVLSAGFAGLAALVAAVIVMCAVLYVSRRAGKRSQADLEQRERHHEELREQAQHATAVARCWDRWWQVLETAAIEPAASEGATLGLGPEVTLVVLRGLLRDAEELGDDTLAKAVAVYQEQLMLVLAQQRGPLSALAAAPATSPNGARNNPTVAERKGGGVAAESGPEPGRRTAPTSATGAAAKAATAETPSATTEETNGRRRRE